MARKEGGLRYFRELETGERLTAVLKGVLLGGGAAWVYYGGWIGALPGILVGIYVCIGEAHRQYDTHRQKLLEQFKELITSMQGLMKAGYSMENSVVGAGQEIAAIYGEKTAMVRETEKVKRDLELNKTLDTALYNLAERLRMSEVTDFVEVITTVRRTGGNAVRIIGETIDKIIDEIELKEEISVTVAAKRMEQEIMTYMPAAIVTFLRLTNSDFVAPLYAGVAGHIFMTMALMINVAADVMGKRIVDIRTA